VIYGDESLSEKLEILEIELGERFVNRWEGCIVPKGSMLALVKLIGRDAAKELRKREPQYIKQIQYLGVNSVSRKWEKVRTYGGKLVENVTQAVARDFLAEAMVRVENAGYPIVASVHDEIIAEREAGAGSLEEFEQLMRVVPKWGNGCPIEVEGFESVRYRK
jgi:hypothetical protein